MSPLHRLEWSETRIFLGLVEVAPNNERKPISGPKKKQLEYSVPSAKRDSLASITCSVI